MDDLHRVQIFVFRFFGELDFLRAEIVSAARLVQPCRAVHREPLAGVAALFGIELEAFAAGTSTGNPYRGVGGLDDEIAWGAFVADGQVTVEVVSPELSENRNLLVDVGLGRLDELAEVDLHDAGHIDIRVFDLFLFADGVGDEVALEILDDLDARGHHEVLLVEAAHVVPDRVRKVTEHGMILRIQHRAEVEKGALDLDLLAGHEQEVLVRTPHRRHADGTQVVVALELVDLVGLIRHIAETELALGDDDTLVIQHPSSTELIDGHPDRLAGSDRFGRLRV